jgi:hypothetical protein
LRVPLHLAAVTMRSAVWSAVRTLIRETVAPIRGFGNRTPAVDLPALRVHVRCMIATRDMTAPGPEQPVRRRMCDLAVGSHQLAALGYHLLRQVEAQSDLRYPRSLACVC